MKNRYFILSISICLLVLVFILPFFLKAPNESINQILNFSFSLVGGLATLYTLIIAVLLYNKFGIENTFVETTTVKVFDLLEEIKTIKFSLINKDKILNVEMINPMQWDDWKKYTDAKILFSRNYIRGLEKLFLLSESPLIPGEISRRIGRLKFTYISYLEENDNQEDYFKVLIFGTKLTESERFGLFNGDKKTVSSFMLALEFIKNDIEKWLKENSSIPIILNI